MMSMKLYICPKCDKNLANRHSLHRHQKNCQGRSVTDTIGQKRVAAEQPLELKRSIFSGSGKESKNPKIQALVNAIINDPTSSKKPSPAEKFKNIILKNVKPEAVEELLPSAPSDVVSEVFPRDMDEESETSSYEPPSEVANDSIPRTKEDIMGWCDDDESEDDEDELLPTTVDGLPDTVDGLEKRFKKLFCQFMRNKQYQHRNELICLLDELLRQEAISQEQYTQLNDMMAQSLNESDDELILSSGEKMEKMIQSVVEYAIAHDKKELIELIQDFKEEAGDDYAANILKLEELVNLFLVDEHLEGEPILPMISDLMRELESSHILRSKHHRFKMLLNDINNNRYRVNSILTRLKNTHHQQDVARALQQLAREDLLSHDQYEKLMELEEMNLPMVGDIVKETKVGQGLKFLPRTLVGLKNKLPLLLEELAKTGMSYVRNEVAAVLEELLRRKGISLERYKTIKEDNNIL